MKSVSFGIKRNGADRCDGQSRWLLRQEAARSKVPLAPKSSLPPKSVAENVQDVPVAVYC